MEPAYPPARGKRALCIALILVSLGILDLLGPARDPSAASVAGQQSIIVRDSAGVQIVESRGSLWRRGEEWQVSLEPVLRIGALEGPEAEMLYGVQWAGRLSDGRIVILNAGSQEVRVFDHTGRHLYSFGRRGEGPGEFMVPRAGLVLDGDSILIKDRMRVSVFTDRGDFVRSFQIPDDTPVLAPSIMGQLGDYLLFRDGDYASREFRLRPDGTIAGPPEIKPGMDRGRYVYLAYDFEGKLVDTLGVFRGAETWLSFRGRGQSYSSIFFGRSQKWAVGRQALVTGWNDTFEIHFFDPQSHLVRIARVTVEPVRVSERSFWEKFERDFRDTEPGTLREIRETYEEMPHYRTLPAFAGLSVDVAGNTWVQSYSLDGLGGEPSWWVLGSDGRMLGEVSHRPKISIDEIGSDYILGRTRDELGVEYVVLYRLDREATGGPVFR